MKYVNHIGVYGIIKNNDEILLIDKVGGPYDGMLDLPGGTLEHTESTVDTLIRELKEEVGIDVLKYKLIDVVTTNVEFKHKGMIENIHHIGIIYEILEYTGNIKEINVINEINDDSKGSKFYDIKSLNTKKLSNLVQEVLTNKNFNI